MVTGTIGAFRGYSYSKYCYNYQYISLIGEANKVEHSVNSSSK